MAKYTHSFCVEREIDGETVELQLEAEFEIEPFIQGRYSGAPEDCYPDEGGNAYIEGHINVIDDEGNLSKWDGTLTDAEEESACNNAYEAWVLNEAESFDEDDYVIDDFDDSFHDDRAISLSGGGKVYY